jgi:hypothetical protein
VVKPTAETAAMETAAMEATGVAARMPTAMAPAAAVCSFGRLCQYENACQSGCSKAQPACYADRLHVATPLSLPPPKRRSCENDWQRPMARSWPEDEIDLKVSVGRICASCSTRSATRAGGRLMG